MADGLVAPSTDPPMRSGLQSPGLEPMRRGLEQPQLAPVEQIREKWRGPVAMSLLFLLLLVIVLPWCALAFHWATDPQTIKDLQPGTLAAIVGLVGAAVGFYFGSNRQGPSI